MIRKLYQKDLAAALGISAPMVTKLKGLGMPTHSIAAAKRWRQNSLNPTMTKEARAWSNAAHQSSAPIEPDAEPSENAERTATTTSQLVKIAERLGLLAEKDFAAWRADLVDALQQLARHAPDLEFKLPMPVWDQLTTDTRAATDAWAAIDGENADAKTGQMSEEDIAYMGRFWHLVACGWVRVKTPDEALQGAGCTDTAESANV